MSASTTAPPTTFAERAVTRITDRLSRRTIGRRRFLARFTVVAAALAIDPVRYVLRPGSALASVCGGGASCNGGWTAFCCTINAGANTCPEGSFPAGWWKVDQSDFCRGMPRYIIDCNRLPDAHCSCTCADGPCDKRRVCCNVFRYGQCHNEIPGITEVVCRVVTCTVPWEWDEGCSDTVRTDNQTASHTAACLPGPNPSHIEIRYQDIGLVGSIVGAQTEAERDEVGGGRSSTYERGVIVWSEPTRTGVLDGDIGAAFVRVGGVDVLGYPVEDAGPTRDGRGRTVACQDGSIWSTESTGAQALTGPIHAHYVGEGGPTGWLGYPTSDVDDQPGPWRRATTEHGWQVVHQTERDEVRVLDITAALPEDGSWPATVTVQRWRGDDRIATAIEVARRTWPQGTDVAVIASAITFPDGLAGGVAAAMLGGPLLLSAPEELSAGVAAALHDLGVQRVIVVGGPLAISPTVVDQLAAQTETVERMAGASRHETAVVVSRALFPDGARTVHVATGRNFADALVSVPAAVAAQGPLLLVDTDEVPTVVSTELRRLAPDLIVLLGGTSAVSRAVATTLTSIAPVSRVNGGDRYETAALLAVRHRDGDVDRVLVVTGDDFADGLSGGAAAATMGIPVLLTKQSAIPTSTWQTFVDLAASSVVLIGGTGAISGRVGDQFGAVTAPTPRPDPAPTPTASDGPPSDDVLPTPSPTDSPSPSPSPTPTATPSPTPTPTPTPTPSPTPAPTSTPTPTRTPKPTSTPTP